MEERDYGYSAKTPFPHKTKRPVRGLLVYTYRLAHLVLLPSEWSRDDLFLYCFGLFYLFIEAAAHKNAPNISTLLPCSL